MRKKLWLGAIGVILCVIAAVELFSPKSLIKNGELSRNFDGWKTTPGISIFHDPTPHDWHFYLAQLKTGGIFHLGDVRNDHFAAIGAGDTPGSVLSQTVPLDGKGGRYELSFVFAATGDAGRMALLETSAVGNQGLTLLRVTLTNTQPAKTYYVPRSDERIEKLSFDVPAGTASVKVSFADKSPNNGVAVDPLIKNVRLSKSR